MLPLTDPSSRGPGSARGNMHPCTRKMVVLDTIWRGHWPHAGHESLVSHTAHSNCAACAPYQPEGSCLTGFILGYQCRRFCCSKRVGHTVAGSTLSVSDHHSVAYRQRKSEFLGLVFGV